MDREYGTNEYYTPEECPVTIKKATERLKKMNIDGDFHFTDVQIRTTSIYEPADVYVYGRIKAKGKVPLIMGPMARDGYRNFYIKLDS